MAVVSWEDHSALLIEMFGGKMCNYWGNIQMLSEIAKIDTNFHSLQRYGILAADNIV